ncbi:hypothetical protein M378DRAFT_173051 [Amanita muscaria Koide BX008]|uniref:Uncharacterized protein n=1 Tax=Amanita muscaria (strain Koide BX008) TaxID=946122 RepID=A0A0C2SPX1_AMAMK|nr:hypothetical protein M378DRAFT_173051 [Amanita muscaria Koide BX008]
MAKVQRVLCLDTDEILYEDNRCSFKYIQGDDGIINEAFSVFKVIARTRFLETIPTSTGAYLLVAWS